MRLIAAAVAVFVVCACGASAAPQRKIAVLGVERHSGANDPTFAAWLAKHVDARFEVVAARGADRPDVEEIDEDAIREVASRLGAEAVVYGELSKKKKGKMRLTVRVYDGLTGNLIETHKVAIRGGKVVAKQEQRFARELLALLPVRDRTEKKRTKKPRRQAPERDDDAQDEERVMVAAEEVEPVQADADAEPEAEPGMERTGERRGAGTDPQPKRQKRAAEVAEEPEEAEEPAAPVFEPAEDAKPTKFNPEGQAVDEEMPATFVKK